MRDPVAPKTRAAIGGRPRFGDRVHRFPPICGPGRLGMRRPPTGALARAWPSTWFCHAGTRFIGRPALVACTAVAGMVLGTHVLVVAVLVPIGEAATLAKLSHFPP